jgi:uncharacterized membrane protein
MTTSRLTRLRRHALTDRGHVRRAFPPEALKRIEDAIAAGERLHGGQVMFAVEPALPLARVNAHLTPRERALEIFGLLRVWDTEDNNGVLIYLLLADHDVEIVADRGIDHRVGHVAWQAICARMQSEFHAGRFAVGVAAAIVEIGQLLTQHYPLAAGGEPNELPNKPVLL